jgi:hypothetical protein
MGEDSCLRERQSAQVRRNPLSCPPIRVYQVTAVGALPKEGKAPSDVRDKG